jgi:hypothetical protein
MHLAALRTRRAALHALALLVLSFFAVRLAMRPMLAGDGIEYFSMLESFWESRLARSTPRGRGEPAPRPRQPRGRHHAASRRLLRQPGRALVLVSLLGLSAARAARQGSPSPPPRRRIRRARVDERVDAGGRRGVGAARSAAALASRLPRPGHARSAALVRAVAARRGLRVGVRRPERRLAGAPALRSRRALRIATTLAAGATALGAPLFFFLSFGAPNLIAASGGADPALISWRRVWSLAFDLDQDLIAYMPASSASRS